MDIDQGLNPKKWLREGHPKFDAWILTFYIIISVRPGPDIWHVPFMARLIRGMQLRALTHWPGLHIYINF